MYAYMYVKWHMDKKLLCYISIMCSDAYKLEIISM